MRDGILAGPIKTHALNNIFFPALTVLKYSGNYMYTYHLLKYVKSLLFAHRVYVFVSYCPYRTWIKFLCRLSPLFVVTYQWSFREFRIIACNWSWTSSVPLTRHSTVIHFRVLLLISKDCTGEQLPTFRENVASSFSKKIKAIGSSEMSVPVYQSTRLIIPEHLKTFLRLSIFFTSLPS